MITLLKTNKKNYKTPFPTNLILNIEIDEKNKFMRME